MGLGKHKASWRVFFDVKQQEDSPIISQEVRLKAEDPQEIYEIMANLPSCIDAAAWSITDFIRVQA